LLLLLSLLTSGCAALLPREAQERQIVVMWHTFTGNEAKALETLTDRFNDENPWHIVLVTEYQEQLFDKLLAAPESRPDLVTVRPEDLQTYAALDIIGAPPVESPQIQEDWGDVLPMARTLYAIDGVPQALPLGLSTYLVYYNTEWLADLGHDAAAADWEDFQRTACAATDPLRGRVGLGVPARASILLAFLSASGSEVVDTAGYYQFADDEGHAAAALLQSVMAGGCGVVYEDWDRGLEELSKSAMAMIVESSERLTDIENEILAGRNFQLGLAPLPGLEGTGATLWYGPGLMVSAPDGPRQEAALNVLSWFFSPEAQTVWGKITEFIPVRRSVVESAFAEVSEELLLSPQAQLWQLTLAAADSGAWFSWPLATNRITCRASLLRGLLAFQQEEVDTDAYVNTAVTACNTGVGFRPIPTPVPAEDSAP
jgi:sn-glycerol 3-phosphate transport system substrate-binding protein